jgi:hypothetical protein
MKTEVSWDNPEPDFHHRMIMPISLELIVKMVNF